ncbi:hypothetical protein [Streptomyces sp. NPDC020298]|uniref:hypothetical protein n=1 Tax=unclassified Streptomyces TaxID=2593676 RepID=UPI0033F9A91C
MGYRTRAYGIPGSLDDYHPDPQEPVERWFTMPNTGNSRAIAEIINDLCPVPPTAVVDPFCGAGSSSLAARRLGVPFVGVEMDPVLACVSTAKSLCGPADGQALLQRPETGESLPLRCLRLLLRLQSTPGGGRLSDRMIADDLLRAPRRVPGGAVVCGDCTAPATWKGMAPLPDEGVVVFTSPPFFDDWAGPGVPPALRAEAAELAGGTAPEPPAPCPPAPARDYGDLLVGALRAVGAVLPSCTVIVEHEPGSGSPDRLRTVADRLTAETDAEILEILETRDFSPGGLFSLLVCRLR